MSTVDMRIPSAQSCMEIDATIKMAGVLSRDPEPGTERAGREVEEGRIGYEILVPCKIPRNQPRKHEVRSEGRSFEGKSPSATEAIIRATEILGAY